MKYPIGIQNFEKLCNEGYVYVDKTAKLYELADRGCYYFLGRPRRFGKSLLLSTFSAYFSGRKDLFKGLAIEGLEKEWSEYPVLYLDLNTGKYDSKQGLEEILNDTLSRWETLYGSSPTEANFELRFKGIVERACLQSGKRVVVLVDEYDKPLLQAIDKPELQEEYRSMLKAFYGVLKTQDKYIRFGFLTGVTKFSHVSIFSDLNNLKDISMDCRYADICGITEKELHKYFDGSIRELAEGNGIRFEEASEELRKWYDGYHFCENSEGVYNPFSLLNAFDSQKFNDYWFETGTPSFLVKLLKESDYELNDLQNTVSDSYGLKDVDKIYSDPTPLLYQSGYLTIKGYDPVMRSYSLGYPNQEVERSFTRYLAPFYTTLNNRTSSGFLNGFIREINSGKPEEFLLRLQTMLADNDYRVAGKKELYFQNVIYVVFKLLGFYAEVERATSRGRIDITIQTQDYIYIMELKLDQTAEEALRQIKEKGYAQPFQRDSRKLFLIGINFSSETRTLGEWVIE